MQRKEGLLILKHFVDKNEKSNIVLLEFVMSHQNLFIENMI